MALSEESARKQEFLDNNEYAMDSISVTEWMHGGFSTSYGGLDTTTYITNLLDLKPGQKLLDVGCGMGGDCFVMLENCDMEILGVDISANMLSRSRKTFKHVNYPTDKMNFMLADITEVEFDPCSFDVVYARDTFTHIYDKASVIQKCTRWLKPEGTFFFSDVVLESEIPCEKLQMFAAKRDYHIITSQQYRTIFEKTRSYQNIFLFDKKTYFLETLRKEYDNLINRYHPFIMKFSKEQYQTTAHEWYTKMRWVRTGDISWEFCYAKKHD